MMKSLLFLTLMLGSVSSWAGSGREAWKASPMKGRVELLNQYTEFYSELSSQQSSTYDKWSEKKTSMWSLLIDEVWANSNMDCIYAGWPSKRVGGLCSSPARNNPDYENGSCDSSQLQCQPMFFGNGHCVPTSTREQRNLAFSNCNTKFKASGKTAEDVIREIQVNGKEAELLELIDFADKICSTGKQASTPMCKRLAEVVDSMRHYVQVCDDEIDEEINEEKEAKDESVAIETEIELTKIPKPVINIIGRNQIVQAVTMLERVNDELENAVEVECDPEEQKPFEREEPRPFSFEYQMSKSGADPAWNDTFVKDKNDPKDVLRPTGFKFSNIGPNNIIGSPLDPGERVERDWQFLSEDNSRRETYLRITDSAGSVYLSQQMESMIFIVPRKVMPNIETVNDELHVTLTTGEKIVYDKATKKVKSGVLTEGPVDLNPNRFNRRFAAISYNGTGITIRIDKRGEDPRLAGGMAVVMQNGRTCQVPAQELWNGIDFRFPDDKGLVEFLNRKCDNKFSIE